MAEIKVLTPAQLIDGFTQDMLDSDPGEDNIRQSIAISSSAKELFKKGKEVIPKIGAYLMKIEGFFEKLTLASEKETIRRGWILFLVEIVNREKISMTSLVTTFDEWRNWAANFKP